MEIYEIQKQVHDNAKDHGWWDTEFSDEELQTVYDKLEDLPDLFREKVVKKLARKRSFAELIALCHSELSEALEEYRKGNIPTERYYSDKNGTAYSMNPSGNTEMKPEGIPSELADAVIRIMDMFGHYGIDLEDAIEEKHRYNQVRPYKHGGKVL
jgi:NTP pyrophosphatase (non-canonical NTP hydrolase)